MRLGGMVKDIGDSTTDRVADIMNMLAQRLNEMESRTITPEYIARLEQRISDLENK